MAIAFKNSSYQGVDTTFVTVYTCPALTTAVVFGLTIANRLGSEVTVRARIRDDSAVTDTEILGLNTPIPAGSSLVVAGGVQKIVLEAGDYIQVISSIADGVDVFISALQMT